METQLPPFQYPSSTQRIDACAQLVGNGESSVCLRSTALRDDIRKRYDYIPADVLDNWKISRDTKQCQGIHEAARRSQVIIRARHGLRRFDVGHNQGLRHAEGTSLAPFFGFAFSFDIGFCFCLQFSLSADYISVSVSRQFNL